MEPRFRLRKYPRRKVRREEVSPSRYFPNSHSRASGGSVFFLAFWTTQLALLTVCVFTSLAAAQWSKEVRVAVIGAPEEPRFSEIVAGLQKGLSELGYPSQILNVEEIRLARAEEKNARANIFTLGWRFTNRAIGPLNPIITAIETSTALIMIVSGTQ